MKTLFLSLAALFLSHSFSHTLLTLALTLFSLFLSHSFSLFLSLAAMYDITGCIASCRPSPPEGAGATERGVIIYIIMMYNDIFLYDTSVAQGQQSGGQEEWETRKMAIEQEKFGLEFKIENNMLRFVKYSYNV